MPSKSGDTQSKRLKVFVTRIGLHEWAVAVSSQKAALKAWDVRENLFASGAAKETNNAAAVEVALKAPGEAVRVPAGKVVLPPPKPNVVNLEGRRPKPRLEPSRAKLDRTKLDAAEKALAEYAKESKRRRTELERRRRVLDDEAGTLESEITRQTKALEARVLRERAHLKG